MLRRRPVSCALRARTAKSLQNAIRFFCEPLEQRVLLSDVPLPLTASLNTGVQGVVQTASQVQNVQNEVDAIHDKLTSVIGKLPLVGDAMTSAISAGTDAFNDVAGYVKSGLDAVAALGTIKGTDLQDAIFTALGPPSGHNILPASITSASDVPIQLVSTDGNDANGAEQVQLNLDVKGTLFTSTLNPKFDIGLPGLGLAVTSGNISAQATYDIKLNIGVNETDGIYLDLSNDSEISLTLAVTAPGLHIKGNLGFLQLDATDGTPVPGPTQHTQLVGTISADLSVGGTEKLNAGNIGSLLSHSSLDASAEADVHLHATLSFGGSANFPSLQADFDMTWKLSSASLDGGGTTDSHFGAEPDFAFNNIQLDLGSFFSKFVSPIVDEVKTVLKPFQPIIDVLNTRMPLFSDLAPLRDGFGNTIPKFDTNSDGTVTLIELMSVLDPGAATTFLSTVVGVNDFVNKIPSIAGTVLLPLGSFDLGGSSNSNNADLRGLSDLTGIDLTNFSANNISAEMTSIGNSIGGDVGGKIGSFLGEIADQNVFGGGGGANGGGLKFPILDDPGSAFKMLLGQDVNLFTFDTPTLDLSAPLDAFFPILGPLGVELRGTLGDSKFVEVNAHAMMAYDTYGIREFATTDGFDPSDVTDLFDGFYIDDKSSSATVNFGLEALAALDVVVFSAGVGGGIHGTATLTAHDPDDDGNGEDFKLRPKEIISDFKKGPLCLFEATGEIDASLNAYIRVGFDTPVGFVGYEHDFELASTKLLDFSLACPDVPPPNPPVLATLLGDGTLRLNMGTYAADRVNLDTTDGDENFKVMHVSTQSDGTETVDVMAFDYVQEYSGVKKIYAEGGHGNDIVTITGGVISPTELWGDFNPSNPDNGGASDSGNDTMSAANGPATLHGGGGDDQLSAGTGNASLYGDEGTDLLTGGSGDDYLDGGAGNDSPNFVTNSDGTITAGSPGGLYGMGGNDTLVGGDGNDYLDGGDGNDSLDGGANDDHLVGGAGNDSLNGGDGKDVLEGNADNDSMSGGSGDDLLLGDDSTIVFDAVNNTYNVVVLPGGGNDSMSGGDGNDSLYGEGGNDSISGDANDDYMHGDAGNDSMSGGDGKDSMVGGQGNDSMTGEAGNDIMLGDDGEVSSAGVVTLNNSGTDGNDSMSGGDGTDVMYGQGGNDSMTGDADADLMLGNAGGDNMSGGGGNDSMIGGQGNDSMNGDAGADIMLGDDGSISGTTVVLNSSSTDGNDSMSGGDGNDSMFGQGGNDSMLGNADDDSMSGGDGADSMIGGQGNDSMNGDAGADLMLGDDGTISAGGVITLANSPTDGTDLMSGGAGNDEMYGQGGNDTMNGDADDDDMVGGGGNDSMDGGTGNDAMLGDDGFIARSGSIFNTDGSFRTDGRVFTLATTSAGNDFMAGGDGHDSMNGQGGNDVMTGNGGDDDMIGGLGADNMDGGDGYDVMLGDDGSIATPVNVTPPAVPESSAIRRTVTLGGSASDGNDSMVGGTGSDSMYGEGGADLMSGNDGDDYMEGNAGGDNMSGNAGDDDMIGGSSVAGSADGADLMSGGDGNDVMLGDNGQITRPTDSSGTHYLRNTPGTAPGKGVGLEDNAVIRNVTLLDVDTIGGADSMNGDANDDIMHGGLGNDVMNGNDGNDQMYGELGDDLMDGGNGNDAMLGDKGIIVAKIFDGSTQTTLASNADRVTALVNVLGTINWSVTLIDAGNGGNDSMNGGLGDDAMHGGAGADLMNGDNPGQSVGGNDVMFGDAGNDRVFGGVGDDQLFGGDGDDYLDGQAGADIIYGGGGEDSLYADIKDDRLIDWFGNFNSFNVPGPGFGAPTIIRSPNPQMRDFLLSLGAADGAVNPELEMDVITPPSPADAGHGTGGSH